MHVQAMREIWFHAHISHPSIVPMYAAWLESDRICIAVEYAHAGSVFRSLRRHSRTLEAVEAGQRIMQPVLSALLFMHELGLVHRDIKCVSSLLPGRDGCFSARPVTTASGPIRRPAQELRTVRRLWQAGSLICTAHPIQSIRQPCSATRA